MDDFWMFMLVMVMIAISLSAGIITHDVLESPYDKCLDSCDGIFDDLDKKECIINCNENLCINKLKGEN